MGSVNKAMATTVILGLVLGAAMLWQGLEIRSLKTRITEVEATADAATERPARDGKRPAAGRRDIRPERRGDNLERRFRERALTLPDELARFAEEHELDAETTATLERVILQLFEQRVAIRREAQSGAIDRREARSRNETLRRETLGEIIGLIGEERAVALRKVMTPERGKGGKRRLGM